MLVEFFILLSVCLFLFYKWFTVHYDFFKKRNIPFEKPVPFFGSHKDVIFQKISIRDHLNEMYKKFHKHKVFGFFDQRTPIYCIRDPDIAKLVTVEKFDHFVNHILILDDHFSGLLGKSLFFMKNDRWKDMRVTLSPVFTAKKMRLMFELINTVAYESIEYLKKNITDQTEFEINHKDYFSRFTNDVIGSVVFGLNVNSFKDVKNEFYLMGKKVTGQTLWQRIKFFFFPALKHILKLLKQEVFDEGAMNYFTRIVLDTMKYRHQNNIYRPDMVNMLMEAKGMYVNKEETDKVIAKREWTDIDLVAQLYLFFFAGFETTSSLMAFATYEIMENPDIQDRLRAEILEVKKSLNGKPLTYDVVHNMKYMGMVVSETLRKWSPGFFLDSQCNKNFSYKDDDVEINIKAGDYVWIPVIGFHLDEQYFPDPLKFDPERFSEENKQNIKPFTYLPFGIGPRFCIGGRFALIQTKTILFYLLSEYRVEVCPKTARPLQIDPKNFNVAAKGGFWAKLVKLQS